MALLCSEQGMLRKVVVTNGDALLDKYGRDGKSRIDSAIRRWIAADAVRGLEMQVADTGDSHAMRACNVAPVRAADDDRASKVAIDALAAATMPDYLVLLGASDVVPLQRLVNPVAGDGDACVPSDLPYACDRPHSSDIAQFLAPSRIVGRLPDLVNATDPAPLVRLINRAATSAPQPLANYRQPFILTATAWAASTRASVANVFGLTASHAIHESPSRGPSWTGAHLAALTHFINCHGVSTSPQFFGDDGINRPVSLSASNLRGRVAAGTVVAAECCYGAELYDPGVAQGQPGICQQYLDEGACGFFGSSNTSYGQTSGNSAADLIAQYFLREVLDRASLGRAALVARQSFARICQPLDPVALKTLAQFCLLGDPSICPAEPAASTIHMALPGREPSAVADEEGNEGLRERARELERTVGFAKVVADRGLSEGIEQALARWKERTGMSHPVHSSYEITPSGIAGEPFDGQPSRLHLLTDVVPDGGDGRFKRVRVLVAWESGGRILKVDDYVARTVMARQRC